MPERAADVHLGRLRAAPPLPDVDAAWALLRRALTERVAPSRNLPVREPALPRRILAVDDERHVIRLIEINLARAGYQVTTASAGREALRKVAAERPDLVVLDVMMPKLTGYDVTRELRANAATSRIPVILLTARVQEADVARGFEAGADDYVKKPFSPQELKARVQAVLGRR